MNMNDFRRLQNADLLSRGKLADEIRELSQRAASIDNEISDAVETQNLARYTALKAEKEMLAESIRAKRQRLIDSRLSFDKREEVLSGWRKYTLKFNAEFSAKLAKYAVAKRTLAKEFLSLVEMQQAAIADRAAVNSLVNENREAVRLGIVDDDMSKLELIDIPSCYDNTHYHGRQYQPEAAFFEEAGEIDRQTAERINYVVMHQGVIS